jgi:predicted Zn-dependent protease
MEKFRELTDPKKLAVKPPRVRIRSAPQGGSVRGVLVALGVPEDDLERTALLNGKTLNENIGAGTMMKVIGK